MFQALERHKAKIYCLSTQGVHSEHILRTEDMYVLRIERMHRSSGKDVSGTWDLGWMLVRLKFHNREKGGGPSTEAWRKKHKWASGSRAKSLN